MAKSRRYGGSGADSGFDGSGGGLNVTTRDLVSERERKRIEVDDVLSVARDLEREYGDDGIVFGFDVATPVGRSGQNVMAYYDGENIAVMNKYFDAAQMQEAYDRCVDAEVHPSRGHKTGLQATVAHEFGHLLTGSAAKKMGMSFDAAAKTIVEEARKTTGDRGSVIMARKISIYATANYAETIAEAYADVYCNGSRGLSGAQWQSKAIVNVLNKYLKGR